MMEVGGSTGVRFFTSGLYVNCMQISQLYGQMFCAYILFFETNRKDLPARIPPQFCD